MNAATLQIFPESYRTGVPITVITKGSTRHKIIVTPVTAQTQETFAVMPDPSADGWSVQFSLAVPGTYRVTSGTLSQVIRVSAQENLTFFSEFGFFITLFLATMGAIAIWLIKRQTKRTVPKVGFS